MNAKRPLRASRQRGIATLLIILMTGLALTATAIGVMYSVRGTQEKALSVHSATQAQQIAWGGVEMVRSYLLTLDAATLAGLRGDLPISGIEGLSARIEDAPVRNASDFSVTVDITGTSASGSHAEARSTVQAVFVVTTALDEGESGSIGAQGAVNINGDLNMSGNVAAVGFNNTSFNVKGNVNLSGSVTGIDCIRATGNVSISSGIVVNCVQANGNIALGGSAAIGTLEALGNVTLSGGATRANSIQANGNVTLSGGSANAGTIDSQGNVSISGGGAYANTVNALGYIDWTSSASATALNANGYVNYAGSQPSPSISAKGNVTLSGGGAAQVTSGGNLLAGGGEVAQVYATGNLSSSSGKVLAGTLGGRKSCPASLNCPGVIVQSGYSATPTTVSVDSARSVSVNPPQVDAYALRDSANYIFETDSAGYRKVTVQNIAGIAPGSYYLGRYSGPYRDYLCTAVSGPAGEPTCSQPVAPYKTICQGQSANNGCITYNSGTATWAIKGVSLAPGVLWFAGNLEVGNGSYNNSLIATGNLATSGTATVTAVNYAGYAPVCANSSGYAAFAGLYPSNFCNVDAGTFISNAVGNTALIAGGYLNGTFAGGSISLGSSNDVYGNVLAGNTLSTTGSTTIHGTLSTAGQGVTTSTSLGGSTIVDISGAPSTFDPNENPCSRDCTTQPGTAETLWTRYY
jgi:hypothetical protein